MMIKNKIPQVVEQRGITPTELHRKTLSLSWPTVIGLSSPKKAPEYLPGGTGIETLIEFAMALGCKVTDLYSVEEAA